MPRKTSQGRVLNSKGFLSKSSGSEGNLSCVRRNGKIFLGYKTSAGWYYTELKKRISSKKMIFTDNTTYLKNNNKENINARKLQLKEDIAFDGGRYDVSSPYGVAFNIGKRIGDVEGSELDKLKVIDKITETGGTIDHISLASIHAWEVEAESAGVTATNISALYLGKPSIGNNITATNTYALELDGHIKSTNLTIKDSGDITLDSEGDINLDINAAADCIDFKLAGTKFASIDVVGSTSSRLTLYEAAGATGVDYFRISANAEGASVLQTIDGSGTDADLEIRADGDLILHSNNGNFLAKNNGTEFSVANSAYAGMILGYTTYGIGTSRIAYGLTTSMVTIHANATVRFIAPPSGVVEVEIQIQVDGPSGSPVLLGLSDNATYNTIGVEYEDSMGMVDETDIDNVTHKWVITGLTAGDTYNYWIGAKKMSGIGGTVQWGGNASGHFGPLVIKVTALPTAVADFAVYG